MIFLFLQTAWAATLTVDPDDAGAWPTVQAAVDDAADGDHIEVVAGTHTGCVDLGGLSLTIAGAGAPETVLDGTGCTALLTMVLGERVELSELTLTNPDGACVQAVSGSLSLADAAVTACAADDAVDQGALSLQSADLLLQTVDLYDNDQNAVELLGDKGSTVVEVLDSSFHGNGRSDVVVEDVDSVLLLGTSFTDTAATSHGAVYLGWGSSAALTECSFQDQFGSRTQAASAHIRNFDDVQVVDSTFTDGAYLGTAGPAGLAVWYADRVHIEGSSFSNNQTEHSGDHSATETDGGALYIYDPMGTTALTVQDCTFQDNHAGGFGGAVRASSVGWAQLVGNRFWDNDASESGKGEGGSGGVMLWLTGPALVHDNDFCGNYADIWAGGLRLNAGQLQLTHSRFVDNNAGWDGVLEHRYGEGGGLYVETTETAEIVHNSYVGNGSPDGAGVWVEDPVDLRHNLFAWHPLGVAVSFNSTMAELSSLSGNAWHGNTDGDVEAVDGAKVVEVGTVTGDPLLVGYTAGGPCEDQDLTPGAGSPLIDAGVAGSLDADGSAADIGSTGGRVDVDGDCYVAQVDTDDHDADVFPGDDRINPALALRCTPTGDGGGDTGHGGDGGADGGSTDGGGADGGSTDGGSTDGGSADGGSTDGGESDSGGLDSGSDEEHLAPSEGKTGCATASGGGSLFTWLLVACFARRRRRGRLAA